MGYQAATIGKIESGCCGAGSSGAGSLRLSGDDAAFAGDEVVGGVAMNIVAVNAFELAGVLAACDRISSFAGNDFARLHREAQSTGLTFH